MNSRISKGYWIWGQFDTNATDLINSLYQQINNKLNGPNFDIHLTISGPFNYDEEKQKETFQMIVAFLNQKYGYEAVQLTLKDTYYNMAEKIKPRFEIIEKAMDAIKRCGLTPITSPIRGGTDGARLTYEGLLCPNLGTGGYQFHGRYEFASIQQMEKALEIMLDIITHA